MAVVRLLRTPVQALVGRGSIVCLVRSQGAGEGTVVVLIGVRHPAAVRQGSSQSLQVCSRSQTDTRAGWNGSMLCASYEACMQNGCRDADAAVQACTAAIPSMRAGELGNDAGINKPSIARTSIAGEASGRGASRAKHTCPVQCWLQPHNDHTFVPPYIHEWAGHVQMHEGRTSSITF